MQTAERRPAGFEFDLVPNLEIFELEQKFISIITCQTIYKHLPGTGYFSQKRKEKWISSPSRFSQSNCNLSVVLQLDKRDYPENSQAAFCPNKQRYFETFMCLDLNITTLTLYKY